MRMETGVWHMEGMTMVVRYRVMVMVMGYSVWDNGDMELVVGSHAVALWVVMPDHNFLLKVLGMVALLTCLAATLPEMVLVVACEEYRVVMVEQSELPLVAGNS